MCSSMNDRIRINQILNDAVKTCTDDRTRTLDGLKEFLFGALQIHYHGLCLDECLEEKARSFAVNYLGRAGSDQSPGRPLSHAA